MKKILLFLFIISAICKAQVTPDAAIKSNTNLLIRNATTVTRSNHSLINDQLTDSKVSRVESNTVIGTNTYSASISWVTSYSDGLWFLVKFTNANTTAATININSLGAKAIKINGTSALVGGEINATQKFILSYDGTNFQLIGAGGMSTFGALTDAFNLSGNGLNYPRVNIGGTALEPRTPSQLLSDISGTPTSRLINTTSPLSGGGDLSADRTFSIADALADASTKGAATFTASDFNSSSGLISLDYTNGQSANGSTKGYLTAADWTTFNAKQAAITFGTGVQAAIGVNIGSAGAPVLFNGAGGTPSSFTLTNATGLPPTTGISGWPANSSGVLTNNGTGTLSWAAAAGGNPFTDNTDLFKNSPDATKLLRFNLSSITTGTTRTAIWPDANITVARNDAAQTFTGVQTFSSLPVFSVPLTTLGTINTGVWQGTKINLSYGGTNADLSATGGTSQFLKQVSTGANITVVRPEVFDISDAGYATAEHFGAVHDGTTDDHAAIQSCIATGNCVLGPYTYSIGSTGLTITTDGTILKGWGRGLTIIKTTANITSLAITAKNCTIGHLQFLGNSTGAAQMGLSIIGNAGLTLDYTNNRLSSLEFTNQAIAGLYIYRVMGSSGSIHLGAVQGSDIYFETCGIGLQLDDRAEYNDFTNINAHTCTTGIKITAGNNSILGGKITDGTNGVVFTSGSNDGKNTIIGLKINHNTLAVSSTAVTLGSLFSACEMIINGSITTAGTGVGHAFKGCTFNNQTITTSAGTTANTLEFMNCTFNGNPTLALSSVATWRGNTFLAGTPPAGVTDNATADAFTFTNNTPSVNSTTGTWTATANSQYHWNYGGSFTSRNTNSDILYGYQWTPSLTVNAGAPTGQNLIATYINPTFTGASNANVGLQIATGQLWLGPVASNAYLAVRSNGTGTNALMRLQNSTPTTLLLMQEDGLFNLASPNARTTTFAHMTITPGSFAPANGTATMDGLTYKISVGQTGTATGALTNINANTTFSTTFTSSTGGNYTNIKLNAGDTWTQTGGSASFTQILSTFAIAQSSSASGAIIGWDYNPNEAGGVLGTHTFVRSRSATALSAFGNATPSAFVTIGAGTTAIAPLGLTSGTDLSSATNGKFEYDGINLKFTPAATTRKVVSLYQVGRLTAQTAAAATVATWTVGANDGTFLVSANVLPTTSTVHSFTVTCTYTDEGNTSRTVTLNFSQLGGTFVTAISNTAGAVPYEGVPIQIRCKAGSTITIGTTGTFTTVTYNVEASIAQIN